MADKFDSFKIGEWKPALNQHKHRADFTIVRTKEMLVRRRRLKVVRLKVATTHHVYDCKDYWSESIGLL